MRIYYATTKTYPASTADHIYIRELAKGFVAASADFNLIVNRVGADLADIPTIQLHARGNKTLSFLVWLLIFRPGSRPGGESVIIANDFNLLAVLVWCRKIFRFKYRIAADLHMLSGTRKDKVAVGGSDILITTSDRLRSVVTERFPAVEGRIHTVHGGVDPALFASAAQRDKADIRRELGLPTAETLVGYVGLFKTMGMDKGIRTMIESAVGADETFVFVGGSTTEIAEYSGFAIAADVYEKCLFVARQDYAKVALYEKAMDVLVIPYPNEPHFTDYGFPMKVYEYLASGVPIVYSDLPIIDEVLQGVGEPFKAGDVASLRRAIDSALSSDAHRAVDVDDLSWKAKAAKIADICTKVIAQNQ